MSILQEAQAILPEIVGWRRYFHQHPELGMDLPATAAKVKEVLDSLGVRYREIIPCGILAYIGKEGGKEHPAAGRYGRPAPGRADRPALLLPDAGPDARLRPRHPHRHAAGRGQAAQAA